MVVAAGSMPVTVRTLHGLRFRRARSHFAGKAKVTDAADLRKVGEDKRITPLASLQHPPEPTTWPTIVAYLTHRRHRCAPWAARWHHRCGVVRARIIRWVRRFAGEGFRWGRRRSRGGYAQGRGAPRGRHGGWPARRPGRRHAAPRSPPAPACRGRTPPAASPAPTWVWPGRGPARPPGANEDDTRRRRRSAVAGVGHGLPSPRVGCPDAQPHRNRPAGGLHPSKLLLSHYPCNTVQVARRTCLRRKSNPARPNIGRWSILMRLTVPSTAPVGWGCWRAPRGPRPTRG